MASWKKSKPSFSLVFFGSSEHSNQILEALLGVKLCKVVLTVTQPPKPAGRHKTPKPSPVAIFSRKKKIPFLETNKLNNETIKIIKNNNPDVGVIAAYGQIIPQTLIDIFPAGIINFHPSYLPELRGPSPVQSAILQNKKTTGISLILIDKKIDHGPILAQKKIAIFPNDNQATLSQRLFKEGAKLIGKTLPQYLRGEIKPCPQDHRRATYTPLLSRNDGFIKPEELKEAVKDDGEKASLIERRWRAYHPWPGIYTFLALPPKPPQRVKILSLHLEGKKLILDQVQFEGRKPISWDKNLNKIYFGE
ncbi:methionyl-tRNA formyltransferase [Candidatus Shapirobacteria bacterium]|nr:methionyl-tRNA formyltransferase [Candidatus Shapirobacteria bacterium]